METLSFAFGVLTVIGVVVTTVVAFGIVKVIKMQKQLDGLEKWVGDSESNLMREIDIRESSLSRIQSDDRGELNRRIDECYRYVDSRLDKMENKFTIGNSAKRQIIND